jgi:hypothetical protein
MSLEFTRNVIRLGNQIYSEPHDLELSYDPP